MATKKITKTEKKTTARPAATKSVKKTTKKTVSKPAVKTISKPTATVVKAENVQASTAPKQTVQLRKSYVVLIIVILLLGAGLYYFRGLFVAAVVNGQPISRLEVVQQTEKQSGKTTLDSLVRNALIEQKAKEQNIVVSDKEVSGEIAKLQANLKKQGQSLDQALLSQGMTQDDLRRLIRLDKLVSKMVGKNVNVSDKEIADYIDKNKSNLPTSDDATLKKQVKAQLTQQKTNEKVRTWLTEVQKQANIVYFVQY